MTQWLVRTAQNRIEGPFSLEEVQSQISGGQLGLRDEVCRAGGYWIYLHEREEIAKVVGVDVPRFGGDDDEITETQTQAVQEVGELSSQAEEYDSPTRTVVLSREPSRAVDPVREGPPVNRLAAFEKPAVLKGVVWVLAVAILGVVYLVLDLVT